jgi:hypothetical protein
VRRVAAILALLGALVPAGCGSSDERSEPSQARSELPAGRRLVIFEPGPLAVSGPVRDETLDQVVELGVNTIRVAVQWQNVTSTTEPPHWDPANPADSHYDFSEYDAFMRAAQARNLALLVTITGPGHPWTTRTGAEGGAPDPERFGDFAAAVARRYGGGFDPDGDADEGPLPAAAMWSVWNEPNQSLFLRPQLRDGQPYSPILYRELYLAAQDSIERADPGAPILIGETAPTGGLDGVDPIPFAEGVLCLTEPAASDPACGDGRIDAAGWATHPYSPGGAPPFIDPPGRDFVTVPSLANLEGVLDGAAAEGQIDSDLPVYVTEYGVQSEPDPTFGFPVDVQAAFISIAEQLLYADPRVASYAQYLMRDDPADHVPGVRFGGFESGLRFSDGLAKPSFESFRLPLAVRRVGDEVSIWGLVRPAAGRTQVEIRVRDGGRTSGLERVATDEAGIFRLDSAYLQGRLWQVRWRSPEGQAFAGPWTAAYAFALPEPPG